MLSRRKVWVDGKLVPFNRAQVHIMSHSFCRGSAVFEVMSFHDTDRGPAVFRLDDHLRRLQRSAELVHMKLPLSGAATKRAVKETVRANKLRQGMVKLMCYYGGVEFEVVPRRPEVTVAVVAVDPLQDLDAERFRKGSRQSAQVTVSKWRKIDPRTVPVECKCSANYLGGMIAKMDAIRDGFTAPVLLDLQGNVAEGATESIFIVNNGVIKTPVLDNILSGITRRTVIEVARDFNLDLVEKKLKPRELYECDEAFFTSSLAKVWPVCRIDKRKLAAPGEVTRLLDKILDKVVAGQAKGYRRWLTPVGK